MTWARLDDTFHHHPKPMQVSLSAIGLFALGLSYAADNETRGRLPERWVLGRIVGDDQSAPQQLVDAGLWTRDGSAYEIHDFHDYNLKPEELEERRRGDRERQRKRRQPPRDSAVTPGTGKGPGSSGSGSGTATGQTEALGREFQEWLQDYHGATGRVSVRGSHSARDQFVARRKEGYSLEELKLATRGCHGDDFCRERGFDVPDTILRASKVERYIELGRNADKPKPSDEHPADRRVREALEEASR